MPDQDVRTFLYEFEAVRPEMITDPTAWTEEDDRIAEAHFAYLKQATRWGSSSSPAARWTARDRPS